MTRRGGTNIGNRTFLTKKIARRGRLAEGVQRKPCDEEATVYVWRESNVLNLPSWMNSEKFATGHAALKLSRFDDARGKNLLVDYISWGGGGEEGEEDADELVRRLRYLHQSNVGEDGFTHAATELWGLLSKSTREALSEREVQENFVDVASFAQIATHVWAALGDKIKRTLRSQGARPNFVNLDAIRKGKPLRSELGGANRERNPTFHERTGRVPNEEIQVLLRLQFLREANDDSEEFQRLAQAVWLSLEDNVKRDLVRRGVDENFTNLDEIDVQRKSSQQVLSQAANARVPNRSGIYEINPRLEVLYREPFRLAQQTGCCGFAAAIMACSILDERVGQKGSFLFELIDAVWHKNCFRGMTVFKGNAETLAEDGCIKARLERRLSVFPPTVLNFKSDFILDYFLSVGLLLFFKSHIKVANPELLQACLDYSERFFDERTGLENFTTNERKLKEAQSGRVPIERWPFMSLKKGDLAVPIQAIVELLKLCGLDGKYQIVQHDPTTVPDEVKNSALCAIVGVGDHEDQRGRFGQDSPKDQRVEHWVVWEPRTNKYWTWGERTTLALIKAMTMKQFFSNRELTQWMGITTANLQIGAAMRFATPLVAAYILPMDRGAEERLIVQRTEQSMNRMFSGRSSTRSYERQIVERSLRRSHQRGRQREVRMTFPSVKKLNLSLMLASKTSLPAERLLLGQYSLPQQMALYKDLQVGKRPYAKLYVPCAAYPAPFNLTEQRERRTPWGLSIDAMRLAMRPYRAGLHPYLLNSFKHNCIGAVWVTLSAGLADVLSAFKPPAGGMHSVPLMALVRTLAKAFKPSVNEDFLFATLVPSDVIGAGEKLIAAIQRLDRQQLLLDEEASRHRDALAKLMRDEELYGVDWHNVLISSAIWRDLSSMSSLRPRTKKAIDALVLAYDKNERAISGANPSATERLLKVEAKWEGIAQYTRSIRGELDKVQNEVDEVLEATASIVRGDGRFAGRTATTAAHPFRTQQHERYTALLARKKKLQADLRLFLLGDGNRNPGSKPALAEYYKELSKHEDVRRSRAKLLVKLNDAIHAYVRGARNRNRNRPRRRYLACLLLGQFVSWRFVEVTHENLSIECHGINEAGFVLTESEVTPGFDEMFPDNRDG